MTGFHDLPAEVRNEIYSFAMPTTTEQRTLFINWGRVECRSANGPEINEGRNRRRQLVALLRVSRSTYNEVASMYFPQIELIFQYAIDSETVLNNIAGTANYIKKVFIINGYPYDFRRSAKELVKPSPAWIAKQLPALEYLKIDGIN